MLMTGNNLTLAGDMPRRVLKCRIDPQTDRPFAREFKLDPLSYVIEHRQEMAAAALTIVRGWLTSGAKRAPGRMASFENWDDFVRQPVAWLGRDIFPGGFADPMEAVTAAQASDPEQESLHEMLLTWQGIYGTSYVTASAVHSTINGGYGDDRRKTSRLKEALVELNNGRDIASAKGLGRILSYRRARIVGGLQLKVKLDKSSNAKMWCVAGKADE